MPCASHEIKTADFDRIIGVIFAAPFSVLVKRYSIFWLEETVE